MVILKFFKKENLIQTHTKTHQIAPFKKFSRGACLRTPPSKAHGFAIRSMSLHDM